MTIKTLGDVAFKVYGRVLTGVYDVQELINRLEQTEAPEDGVIYIPSEATFESLEVAETIKNSFFGGMPIQIGYCNGMNTKLNGVEYHRSSELCIAGTELILLLGKQEDITEEFTYDTSHIEAFKVAKGEVFEMYGTTLHYAPCSVEEKPFRNIVILPKDTNTALGVKSAVTEEDKLLIAKNKWLIAHEDAGIERAFVGLVGENLEV